MTIAVVFNPIAGAGRATQAGRRVVSFLEKAGHKPAVIETKLQPPSQWLDPALGNCEAIVVVGGDGTIRLVCESAIKFDLPIYHYPLGTENLFARQFSMDQSETRLLGSIERGKIQRIDIGHVNGMTFLLMVSVGYDAEVVHDLATHRTGGITHFSYARPMCRQFFKWKPPKFRITLDGGLLVDDQRGFVVIANSSQYGQRLDPARDAIMDDGLLDVVFFPTRSRVDLLKWMWKLRRGNHTSDNRLIYERGKSVEIDCDTPQRFQVDGDRPELKGADGSVLRTPLKIELESKVLSVLRAQ